MPTEDQTIAGPSLEDLFAEGDHELLQIVDRQMHEAYHKGGSHLLCAPGCTECCIGPFGIHRLDVLRLRRGVRKLGQHDPDRASALLKRARGAIEALTPGFPGDSLTGELGARSPEEEDSFLDHHADLACPVLDPATGRCELYAHRPLTCRIYGPAARTAGGILDPCRLCFTTASPETVAACCAEPDPENLEDELLEELEQIEGERGVTLIPFAFVKDIR